LEEALPRRSAIAKVEHHAAMAYRELPQFLATLGQREGTAAQALAFTILTAARSGEVIGATWDEVNLDEMVWTIPASRMKAGRAHKVPLSDAALAILRSAYREDGNDHVFIGGRPGASLSHMAMALVLQRMGRNETAHGFRSSFRVWAAEQTNYPREVAEQALAHTISDKVEAAYKRTTLFDKRRTLMAQWAKFCTTPSKAASADVVPIGGAR
jgi:integrase